MPAINLRMWAIQMSSMLEQPDMETMIADAERLEAYIMQSQIEAETESEIRFESDFSGKRH